MVSLVNVHMSWQKKLTRVDLYLRKRFWVTLAVVRGSGAHFGRYDSRLFEVSTGWQGVVAHPSSDVSNGLSLSRSLPLLACMVKSAGSSSSVPIFSSDNTL
jgi:hypothetical protein